MVMQALKVDSKESYLAWINMATRQTADTLANIKGTYQQFIVHARDERGDPITDFNLQLYQSINNPEPNEKKWKPVKMDVHTYSADNSFRCFHINLKDIIKDNFKSLKAEFIASSGTALLGYMEYLEDDTNVEELGVHPTFTMDLSPLLHDPEVKFFYPFTTTLIEIILNREPLPPKQKNNVTWFLEDKNSLCIG